MFKAYDQEIIQILSRKDFPTNWKVVEENHHRMLLRIQHERLIHLMVTIFVGLVASAASITTIITKIPYLSVFSVPLILLFVGYIFHYRFLENTTQSWYCLEDQIIAMLGSDK